MNIFQLRRTSIATAVAVAILPLIMGCREKKSVPSPPPSSVTVALPIKQTVVEWDEFTGHIDAVETVDVRARVGGLVVSTPFTEGSLVEKDALLVEIDSRPYKAEYDSRVASHKRAGAQVDLAKIQYNRVKELMPQQSASQIEFDTAEATLRAAEADMAAAAAAMESARLNVEWCKVVAPISGRISRKYATTGNLVTSGAQGTLLTTITSIDPIYCYTDADERSVLKYQRLAQEGKRISARDTEIPCYMQLADEAGFPHAGVIDFVDNRLDPQTGTIRARGVFRNPNGQLVPGFFARLRVPGSGNYETLLVPDSAVMSNQNQKMLLVAGKGDIVEARPVQVGAVFGDLRSITSGITTSDRVIINGLMQARPGTKVVVTEIRLSADSAVPFRPEFAASAKTAAATHPTTLPATTRTAP